MDAESRPESRSYSLAELADEADVTPRTIRYYIAQGLLPPPVGAGPTTRYSAGHLGRLRLVRELQRQHLPLAEIRARLEHLTDEDVGELGATFERRPTPASAPGSAVEYIRGLLDPRGANKPTALPRMPAGAPSPAPPPRMSDATRMTGPAPSVPAPPSAGTAAVREVGAGYADKPASSAGSSQPARSQWDRIVLAPDIELHVRRPLSRIQNRAVDRLVSVARQLLEEDAS